MLYKYSLRINLGNSSLKEISGGFEFIVDHIISELLRSIMIMSFYKSESHLVILAAGVRAQEAVLVLGGLRGDLRPLCGGEVLGHPGVEGEHAGGGSKLGAHIADSSNA